jgi:hypothetical protein
MAFLDDMLRGNDVAPSPNRIIQGLKLAALLTERPEQRIDRLSFLAREREGKHRVAQGEERNRLAREREERQQKESKRREEREDLSTRLELGAKGRRLSAEEREGLDTGELLGIDFGAGVNVGAGGMSRIAFGGDEYAIPGREAQGELDLQSELDKQAALNKLKQFPLPGRIAEAVGMKEGTPTDPSVFDDLIRAAQALQPEEPALDKSTFTDASGNTERVFIDQATGEVKNRVSLGRKKVTGDSAAITRQTNRAVSRHASEIVRQTDDPDEAMRVLREKAASDPEVEENLPAIAKAISGVIGKPKLGKAADKNAHMVPFVDENGDEWMVVLDPVTGKEKSRTKLTPDAGPEQPGFLGRAMQGIGEAFGFGSQQAPEKDPLGIR